MTKSPFRILLEQAGDLGIKTITFQVKTESYTENEHYRWFVISPEVQTKTRRPVQFSGVNGQHALTQLVAAKRYEVEQAQRNPKR